MIIFISIELKKTRSRWNEQQALGRSHKTCNNTLGHSHGERGESRWWSYYKLKTEQQLVLHSLNKAAPRAHPIWATEDHSVRFEKICSTRHSRGEVGQRTGENHCCLQIKMCEDGINTFLLPSLGQGGVELPNQISNQELFMKTTMKKCWGKKWKDVFNRRGQEGGANARRTKHHVKSSPLLTGVCALKSNTAVEDLFDAYVARCWFSRWTYN